MFDTGTKAHTSLNQLGAHTKRMSAFLLAQLVTFPGSAFSNQRLCSGSINIIQYNTFSKRPYVPHRDEKLKYMATVPLQYSHRYNSGLSVYEEKFPEQAQWSASPGKLLAEATDEQYPLRLINNSPYDGMLEFPVLHQVFIKGNIVSSNPRVVATCGVHPLKLQEEDMTMEDLIRSQIHRETFPAHINGIDTRAMAA